jgi:hypothetical protein
MVKKIGFIGKAGSGKDYLTTSLICDSGKKYKRFAFADDLKKIASDIFPWLDEDYPPFSKEKPITVFLEDGSTIEISPREVWIGMNCLKKIDPYVFLRKTLQRIDRCILDEEFGIIVTDVRNEMEANSLLKRGFTLIYIEPLKHIYEENEYDKNIEELKKFSHSIFENDFGGPKTVERFMKLINEMGE